MGGGGEGTSVSTSGLAGSSALSQASKQVAPATTSGE